MVRERAAESPLSFATAPQRQWSANYQSYNAKRTARDKGVTPGDEADNTPCPSFYYPCSGWSDLARNFMTSPITSTQARCREARAQILATFVGEFSSRLLSVNFLFRVDKREFWGYLSDVSGVIARYHANLTVRNVTTTEEFFNNPPLPSPKAIVPITPVIVWTSEFYLMSNKTCTKRALYWFLWSLKWHKLHSMLIFYKGKTGLIISLRTSVSA